MRMLRLLTFGLVIAFLTALASGGLAGNTGLIFVSSEQTNSLVIVDPEQKRIVKYLKTSRRPRDMHFNTDHTYLYVACGGDDAIDIIDVAKLEVVGRLFTASNPRAFGISEKQRRIYVPNPEGSSLSVIDMDQHVIIQEVPTSAGPEEVFVSEDGHFVYVASEVGDFIHLVDADRGYVVESVVVGTRPRRFAATSDGKELWVSSELSGEVYIIEREKFMIAGKIKFLPPGVREIDVTPVDLVITKDGKTAYVTLGYAARVAVVPPNAGPRFRGDDRQSLGSRRPSSAPIPRSVGLPDSIGPRAENQPPRKNPFLTNVSRNDITTPSTSQATK